MTENQSSPPSSSAEPSKAERPKPPASGLPRKNPVAKPIPFFPVKDAKPISKILSGILKRLTNLRRRVKTNIDHLRRRRVSMETRTGIGIVEETGRERGVDLLTRVQRKNLATIKKCTVFLSSYCNV